MSLATQAALVEVYIAALRRLRDVLVEFLERLFMAPGSWRAADADRFVATVVPVVLGAQRSAATLTANYLAAMLADQRDEDAEPQGVDLEKVTGSAVRKGADPEDVYRRPFRQVWNELEASERGQDDELVPARVVDSSGRRPDRLPQAVESGRRRARLIGLTDVELATTHTAREVLRAQPRVVGYRRVLTGAENCGLCVVASTQRYRTRELLPIHPRCVPAGTSVRARDISGATRRWYSGELAVLTTTTGDQVAVTPNHPVLTAKGWVPAGGVREGEHLVHGAKAQRVVGDGPDEGEAPVLAEDVWRALAVTFNLVRVPLAAEDFHGDGADGEGDVIRADGYFSTVGNRQAPENGLEELFVSGRRRGIQLFPAGDSAAFVPSGRTTTGHAVRRSDLFGALFGAHLCGPHAAGFRRIAAGNTTLLEPSRDDSPRDPMAVREDVLGEAPVEVVSPELFCRVTHVGRVDFSGHVFNFHTRLGTYEADNYIVHNCDCVVAPIVGAQDPGRVINTRRVAEGATQTGETRSGVPVFSQDQTIDLGQLLEEVHDAVMARFGASARDARRIDYRKVITVREHGELGPLLTVKRHKFTKLQVQTQDLARRD